MHPYFIVGGVVLVVSIYEGVKWWRGRAADQPLPCPTDAELARMVADIGSGKVSTAIATEWVSAYAHCPTQATAISKAIVSRAAASPTDAPPVPIVPPLSADTPADAPTDAPVPALFFPTLTPWIVIDTAASRDGAEGRIALVVGTPVRMTLQYSVRPKDVSSDMLDVAGKITFARAPASIVDPAYGIELTSIVKSWDVTPGLVLPNVGDRFVAAPNQIH